MITCVCMNPALDKTIEVEKFTYGGLNRVSSVITDASGKAVNVAIVLKRLQVECALCGLNFSEGGESLEKRMRNEGIPADFIVQDGALRTNIKLRDRATGKMTEINEKGAPVNAEALDAAHAQIARASAQSDYIVLTGSLPQGTPDDFYRHVIEENAGKARFVLDCDAKKLEEGVKAKPYLVKPNSYELGLLFGHEPADIKETAAMARQLNGQGIEIVVVSMGSDGALISSADECWYSPIVDVPVRSTVGAGDSMVAGLLYGLVQGGGVYDALKWGVICGNCAVMTDGTGLVDVKDIPYVSERVTLERL